MQVRCPYCAAEFMVPDTLTTVTCPYCGTVFHVKAPGVYETSKVDHFYFPLDPRDPYDLLMRFVSRQYGVPADITRASSLVRRQLHYIPVYFFYLEGAAKVISGGGWFSRKRRETFVEEIMFIGIPAVSNRVADLLVDYPFPVRGKRFFEEKVMRAGRYYEPQLTPEEARRLAEAKLRGALMDEARACCSSIRDVEYTRFNVEYRGLVHYPVWELAYRYGGEVYEGFVDGADGRVILVEHPLTIKVRALQIGMALTLIGAGVGLGLLGALALHKPLALLGGVVASCAGSVPLVTRTVTLKVKASQVRELKEPAELGLRGVQRFLRQAGRISLRVGI